MKKSQIKILAILAAVAVLLGAALTVLRYEKQPEVLPPLVDIQAKNIDQLVFSSNNTHINLQLQQDQWMVLLPDATLPANQDMANMMIQQLCQIRPQQLLEELDPALSPMIVRQASIDILSGSGSEQVHQSQQIVIGSMNAITDQLYVQAGEQLYLTDTSLLKIFPSSVLELLQQYAIPKPDDHQSVQVENSLGTVYLSCVGSQTGGPDGVWCVQTADGNWAVADETAAYNFYFLTWDMHFKSTAGYITDSSQLADYGLDHPQTRYTLTYGGNTFELIFGSNLPDNTTYAMCQGSPLVYTMDTLLVQWLTQAKTEDVIAYKKSTSP